jgi:hypothetical protein
MNEKELSPIIDGIHLQLAYLSAQQKTLLTLVLDVFAETLNADEIKNVSKRFCELLEGNLKQAEKDVSKIVSDVELVAQWHLTNREYVRFQKERHNVV